MTNALLCETVTGHSMAELLAARDRATAGDMVELRLDGVSDLDVGAVLAGRRCPVVATCRPGWEGGRFEGSEEARTACLVRAFELGAEFVDVEWRALLGEAADGRTGLSALIRRDARRVVVSMHDFAGVPADLLDRARAMRATGAGTVKIAVTCSRLVDALPLRQIAADGPAVVVGMGPRGVPTRVLAGRFGSRWTYAGDGVAPGQLPAWRMIEDYGFRRVGSSTRLFGVVSTKALDSLSPPMHNAAFDAAGIDAVYAPFVAGEFNDLLAFAESLGVEGVSVTIPFKLEALQAAEVRDDVATHVGAANTLRRRQGRWEATNTDVAGFLVPLESMFGHTLGGLRAAVLGAGGAARAVVAALGSRGAKVTVHARRAEQAAEVAGAFGAAIGPWPPEPGLWDLLVNCTPLGGPGRRRESPLDDRFMSGRLVYDLTYGQEPSALLEAARAAGCSTVDGLPMLVAQAERQFEWWTGRPPGRGVMGQAASRRLRRPANVPGEAMDANHDIR